MRPALKCSAVLVGLAFLSACSIDEAQKERVGAIEGAMKSCGFVEGEYEILGSDTVATTAVENPQGNIMCAGQRLEALPFDVRLGFLGNEEN